MSKDPAVLFYTADFIVGTITMSYEQKGKYIQLLCLQHQSGRLKEKQMMEICGGYDEQIFEKFLVDENGLYYNKRMDDEANKRRKFVEGRKSNLAKNSHMEAHMDTHMERHMAHHMEAHMENENINKNINIIKEIIEHLNSKLKTKYKYNSNYINRIIQARLNEGFNLQDFQKVIDNKLQDWSGTEMRKYLRPETLFGTKFQSYLNEVPKNPVKTSSTDDDLSATTGSSFDLDAFMRAALRRSYGEEDD